MVGDEYFERENDNKYTDPVGVSPINRHTLVAYSYIYSLLKSVVYIKAKSNHKHILSILSYCSIKYYTILHCAVLYLVCLVP